MKSIETQLRQVLCELELVSQVSAVNMDPSSRDSSESIGGKRPPGGIQRKDDRMETYPQKSVEWFRRRALRAHTDAGLIPVLEDAIMALEACRRAPAPSVEPEHGSPQWKRWIAESPLPDGIVATHAGVSRQYVRRIRELYREVSV